MGVLAAFFVYSYVNELEENAVKKFGQTSFVLVASQEIKEMATLEEKMFSLVQVPQKFREPTAIFFAQSKEDLSVARDLKQFAGMVALVAIKKGEQITYNKITDPGIRTGLAPQVTPGKRAIGIPVTEVSGVGKLLKPGDRVDLIGVLKLNETGKVKVARTILQDVLILSVGKNVTNNVARTVENIKGSNETRVRPLNQYDAYTTVNVEVDPIQAQTVSLLLADPDNKIMLSLRNNDDTATKNEPGVTTFNLYGTDADKAQIRFPAQQQGGGGGGR
jgi:pilus assembly protein CpaB